MDELLWNLNEAGYYSIGFADDIAIIIKDKFPSTFSEVLQNALKRLENLRNRTKLSVNPNKMTIVPFTRLRNKGPIKEPFLFGCRIQLLTQVKYLGLILDKGLTWKQHVQHIVTKSLRVFWACRATFGKSWGLKPMMTYWMNITKVRPIVSYAALMRWPRIKKKVCVNELTKLQRTACIGIVGAFRTTPTAALEVAIGLTPLPLLIVGEARASYFSICRFGNVTQRGNIAHLNFSWDTVLENMFNMRTDTAIPRYSFAKTFTVTYPDRSEWKRRNIQCLSKGPIWYTDGSKTSFGTGGGVFGGKTGLVFSLGAFATVFQAEVFATMAAVRESIVRGYNGRTITIFTNSQAALKALESVTVKSKLVLKCLELVMQLSSTGMCAGA
jgi:RNase H.